jgi:hypothetical protein
MKAQVAIEYLMIISFALMILLPFFLHLQTVSSNLSDDVNSAIAFYSMKKIGEMADWVYSQGEPAKITFLIQIPKNVEEISFNGKIMIWKVRTSSGISDISYTSIANLTGSLPTKPGYYNVLAQATENGVKISVSTS